MHELKADFERRFQDFDNFKIALKFGNNPSSVTPREIKLLLEQFELSVDLGRDEFIEVCSKVETYGPDIHDEISRTKCLSTLYSKILSIYADSYACEQGFSAMNFIYNKFRNSLTQENLKNCMIISSTQFEPNFESITKSLECQISH